MQNARDNQIAKTGEALDSVPGGNGNAAVQAGSTAIPMILFDLCPGLNNRGHPLDSRIWSKIWPEVADDICIYGDVNVLRARLGVLPQIYSSCLSSTRALGAQLPAVRQTADLGTQQHPGIEPSLRVAIS